MLDKPPSDAPASAKADVQASTSLAVLIVGMHRSGTSALSGMLNLLGVTLPQDQFPADEHNPLGYFEPRRIIDFHESLLAQLGSPSNDPLPLSYDWVDSPVGKAAAERLADILDEEFGDNALCLFKDPRICRLAPVWTAALATSGRTGVAVLPCRHPLEVAGSLKAKGALSRPYSLFMWLQHVLLGERFTRQMPRSFTFYDALLEDWRGVAAKLERDLGMAWPRDLLRAAPDIDAFLSGGLRHHTSRDALAPHDPLDALCARTWQALHALGDAPYDAAAMAEMDAIWAAFEGSLGVSGPLVVSYQRELDRARRDTTEVYEAQRAEVLARDAEILARDAQIVARDEEILARDALLLQQQELREAALLEQRRLTESAEKAWKTTRARLARREAELDQTHIGIRARDREILLRDDMIIHRDNLLINAWAGLDRLNAIENSTSWKLMTVLHRKSEPYPRLRRFTRGFLKLGWWTVTFKLGRKLRERRALLAGLPAPPLEAAPSQPAPPEAAPGTPPVLKPVDRTPAPHIAFISGEPDTPGHSYRVLRFAEAARTLGATTAVIRADQIDPGSDDFARADLIFIWRAIWTDPLAAVVLPARERGTPVLFDIDDLLIEPELATAEHIDGIRSQRFTNAEVRSLFELMLKTHMGAHYASAPTELLAQRQRRHGRPAFVLPNGFDESVRERSRLAARRRRQEPGDGLVRIGYATGSKTHQKDFAATGEALVRILKDYPNARLVLFKSPGGEVLDIGEFPGFDALMDQIEWRDIVPIEQLPDEVARFDINLAPLEVGALFCEAKSELKFFEAALVDVPTIASPTGPFSKAIRHGVTGFLADTAEEWHAALEKLMDPDLRRRMAAAAQLDALAEYGPERRVEQLALVLEQILGRGRRAGRAFELALVRADRPRPAQPHVPAHEVVFEADFLRASPATVIVPLYNYADYVLEALQSVADQSLGDVDLVVVDDCSTDDSLAVARAWMEENAGRFNRCVLVRNLKNSGLGFTRNVGFANADTPFVLPLDADNRLLPDCLEVLLDAARSSGAAFAYPQLRQFGDETLFYEGRPYDPARFVVANYIDAMALVSRAAWISAGGYDHVRFGWEDYDFWCRLVELGLFGEHVGKVLAEYRVHQTSMLRSETDTLRNKIALADDIERRHPWLHIDRAPPTGMAFDKAPPAADGPEPG